MLYHLHHIYILTHIQLLIVRIASHGGGCEHVSGSLFGDGYGYGTWDMDPLWGWDLPLNNSLHLPTTCKWTLALTFGSVET